MGPAALAQVLRQLNESIRQDVPDLLVGLKTMDDAAVYRLNAHQAVIQTVDFFPPIVDDPYTFGAIAAANAMSDVYAMGGEVLLALNLGAFPEDFPTELIAEIFRGGADKVAEAGGVIAGGHTILDQEPKYGLCITGIVEPGKVVTKGGARVGDVLILTKPLGTGLITTAAKNDAAQPAHLQQAIEWMLRLNRRAAQLMQQVGVHAATDITGFGLLGHTYEMAERSDAALRLFTDHLPILDGALDYARRGHVSGGGGRNRVSLADKVKWLKPLDEAMIHLLHDPQTSGGLLIALSPDKANALIRLFEQEGQAYWVVGEGVAGMGVGVA